MLPTHRVVSDVGEVLTGIEVLNLLEQRAAEELAHAGETRAGMTRTRADAEAKEFEVLRQFQSNVLAYLRHVQGTPAPSLDDVSAAITLLCNAGIPTAEAVYSVDSRPSTAADLLVSAPSTETLSAAEAERFAQLLPAPRPSHEEAFNRHSPLDETVPDPAQ